MKYLMIVLLLCIDSTLFTNANQTKVPDPMNIAVTCCCELSNGGICCGTVPVCTGDRIPGCWCK